jgi:hypothetical protein
MRTLYSGTGKNVMEWCLGVRGVEQKSSVKIQHAQEAAELSGGLGKGAILKMGHFFQWS